MNKLLKKTHQAAQSFAKEEDGAQVVEYALIIAVVSIAMVAALAAIKDSSFSGFITRVQTCLGNTGTCA